MTPDEFDSFWSNHVNREVRNERDDVFQDVMHSLSFHERCKKDGILTYERDCNKLRDLCNNIPFNSLIELLESMPTEQTMWLQVVSQLNQIKEVLGKE